MNKTQVENAYLSAFCDRDLTAVNSAEEKAMLFEQRAEIKVQLKQATTPDQKAALKSQFDEITNKLEQYSE